MLQFLISITYLSFISLEYNVYNNFKFLKCFFQILQLPNFIKRANLVFNMNKNRISYILCYYAVFEKRSLFLNEIFMPILCTLHNRKCHDRQESVQTLGFDNTAHKSTLSHRPVTPIHFGGLDMVWPGIFSAIAINLRKIFYVMCFSLKLMNYCKKE